MRTFLLMLLMCSTCTAHEFMKTAPNGHRYDSRMWHYNKKLQKVIIKPEYKGMSQHQRFKAAGIPHHFDDPNWIAHNQKQIEKAQLKKQLIAQKAKCRSTTYNQRPVLAYRYFYYYQPSYYHWPMYSSGSMWSSR
tara:strand:+ start:237 stop:641 length:405 start_codon:yes stop_codon:yes gene_type:complete